MFFQRERIFSLLFLNFQTAQKAKVESSVSFFTFILILLGLNPATTRRSGEQSRDFGTLNPPFTLTPEPFSSENGSKIVPHFFKHSTCTHFLYVFWFFWTPKEHPFSLTLCSKRTLPHSNCFRPRKNTSFV
jgi:hypothetical protein